MFFRVTRAGRYQYVQIARSYRDGGETKQQTLLSLGRPDVLQAGGQLWAKRYRKSRACWAARDA